MFGLGKTKSLVGLDIGSSAVKAVELRKKGSSYELVNLGIEPLGQDTVVDGAIMDALSVSSAIEKIFNDNRIKTRNVATSVSGHSVIVKRVTVGANTDEELYNAIPYEAQQHIPFDMSDVNLSYQSLGPSPAGSGTDVMLVAVKREKILNHTNVLSQAGKIPTVVDYDGFAVYNAFEVNYEVPPDQMGALLNIGASIMNIVIGRGGNPLFTRDVSVGGNQYTDTLQKELDLSYEDAERLKQGFEIRQHIAGTEDSPPAVGVRNSDAGNPEDLRLLPPDHFDGEYPAHLCFRGNRQNRRLGGPTRKRNSTFPWRPSTRSNE